MPRLYGEKIMLREYRKEDLPSMRKWVNDPVVVDNLSDIFLYPHSVHETESFLNTMLEGKSGFKGFVIADRETEDYIGQIDLVKVDWKNRAGELGIIIGAAEHRGRGIGAKAIRLLQDFAFNRLNLHRLQLSVHDYNEQAIRCYRKCGFREEGRKRESFYIHGRYADTIIMSILRSEYRETSREENQH
jgi:RimJ/RimL family protein N-acetyltransferase